MEILKKAAIAVSQELSSKEEATKLAGRLLKDTGSIQEEYIDSMLYKLENEGFCNLYREWSSYTSWYGGR